MAKKILVVEDNGDSREMFEILLSHEGYHVSTAGDGHEGLEKAKSESPDLIITDVHMPVLDGLEMIRRLRQIPEFAGIPVVILTAEVRIRENAVDALGSYVLTKPVTVEYLMSTIKKLLDLAFLIIAAVNIR